MISTPVYYGYSSFVIFIISILGLLTFFGVGLHLNKTSLFERRDLDSQTVRPPLRLGHRNSKRLSAATGQDGLAQFPTSPKEGSWALIADSVQPTAPPRLLCLKAQTPLSVFLQQEAGSKSLHLSVNMSPAAITSTVWLSTRQIPWVPFFYRSNPSQSALAGNSWKYRWGNYDSKGGPLAKKHIPLFFTATAGQERATKGKRSESWATKFCDLFSDLSKVGEHVRATRYILLRPFEICLLFSPTHSAICLYFAHNPIPWAWTKQKMYWVKSTDPPQGWRSEHFIEQMLLLSAVDGFSAHPSSINSGGPSF